MKKAHFVFHKLYELAFLRGAPRLQAVKKPFFIKLDAGWSAAVQGTQQPMESQPAGHQKAIVPAHGAVLWHEKKFQATLTGSEFKKARGSRPQAEFDSLSGIVDNLVVEQIRKNVARLAKKLEE